MFIEKIYISCPKSKAVDRAKQSVVDHLRYFNLLKKRLAGFVKTNISIESLENPRTAECEQLKLGLNKTLVNDAYKRSTSS